MSRKITATVPAWITNDYFDPKTLVDGEPVKVVGDLHYCAPEADMTGYGWVKVGTAEITLTIDDPREVINNKVDALQAQKRSVMAEAQMKLNKIEGQIQELLCIEHKPENPLEWSKRAGVEEA